jgi:protein O-mannosyl-transferase
MISLMLDYAMGGRPQDLAVFHRSSLVLHVVNAVLVTLLAYSLLGQPWAAAIAGLLFGVHPLGVETIAWIGERKTLLATLFSLACMLSYVHHAKTGRRWAYAVSLTSYALAVLSKPTSVPIPLVLLLLDYWPLRRLSGRSMLEKVPLFALAAVSAYVTVASQAHFGRSPVVPLSAGQQGLLAVYNAAFYPAKMIWPARLSSFYEFPGPVGLANSQILAAAIAVVVSMGLVAASFHWSRACLTGCLCYLVLLSPTLLNKSYSPSVAWNKYVYLPSIGLLLFVGWMVATIWNRQRVGIRRILLASFAVIAAAFIVVSRGQLAFWKDTRTLYSHMLELAPRSPDLLAARGSQLMLDGHTDEAIVEYEKALAARPEFPAGLSDYAAALIEERQYQKALDCLARAIHKEPRLADAYVNAGVALYRMGRLDLAARQYEAALAIRPLNGEAHMNLGVVLAQLGDPGRAVRHLRRGAELLPGDPAAQMNLANGLLLSGNPAEALEHYRRALSLAPNDGGAQAGMRTAMARLKGQTQPASVPSGG